MAFTPVTVEWRQGVNGDGATYTFSPKPVLSRPSRGMRTATLTVPLMDGVLIQNLSLADRTVELAGVLYNKTHSWDDMETARQNMIDGIGTGPGQLHLITSQRHTYYNAQVTTDGIHFAEQSRSNLQDYRIRLVIPDGVEHHPLVSTKTVQSNAKVV